MDYRGLYKGYIKFLYEGDPIIRSILMFVWCMRREGRN